jgi:hypothetical protein
MEPPHEQTFDSRDLMVASVRQHALSQGYAITTIRSITDKYIYLDCDRGGTYRDRVNAPEGYKTKNDYFTTDWLSIQAVWEKTPRW